MKRVGGYGKYFIFTFYYFYFLYIGNLMIDGQSNGLSRDVHFKFTEYMQILLVPTQYL